MNRVIGAVVLMMFLCGNVSGEREKAFSSEQVGFAIKVKKQISQYRVLGVFVLPGEKLKIEALEPCEKTKERDYALHASAGAVAPVSQGVWMWTAPQNVDLYTVTVRDDKNGEAIVLNVFVMVPFTRLTGQSLNGYRIGDYPNVPLKGLDIYKRPRGFIEVTEENQNTLISPHFTLKQFLCKQQGGYPQYLVLQERLVMKLELILEKVNEAGYSCNSLHIMSGYRTPYYNRCIGNVKYSMHVWGGAADFFIDEDPQDGNMDDLNGDGKIDYHDAHILYEIVDCMFETPWYEQFVGGLGRYEENANHGPFVHIDVRGFRARWGT